MTERMARKIADHLGYDFDTLYNNKSEWNDDRGSRHDINVPFRGDFLDAARAALDEMRVPTETMKAAVRAFYAPSFPNDPAPCEGWVSATIENVSRMIDAELQCSDT